jgi:hypothetical protein
MSRAENRYGIGTATLRTCFDMAQKRNVALLFAAASASALSFASTASAQEASGTDYSCTAASASDFSHFGQAIDRPSLACDAETSVTDRLSHYVYLRLAPDEDWAGLDPVATELDLTGTLVVVKNDAFQVSVTGGGYLFPVAGLDATVGTIQLALDTAPIFNNVLTFHFEHGEYDGGFTEGQSEASGTATFPIGGDYAIDLTLGSSTLRETDDDIAFGEIGLSKNNWRVFVEGFDLSLIHI